MKLFITALSFLISNPVMAQSSKITEAFLQSFADAFNTHDLDAIMNLMTEDCIFQASAGPDVDGEKFTGQAEVRKAFEDVFTTFPDARWNDPQHFIIGDRGVTEWTFTGTRINGSKVEVTGCDIFTFSNGKIAVKNSYRKNRIVK